MKSVLRIATMDPDEATRNLLKTLLLGIDTVWLEAECSRYEFFMDVIQQTQPDMALINVDGNPQQAIDLIGEITRTVPQCAVLVTSNSQEGSLILQVIRQGAREFLNMPLQLDDFVAALDRIRAALGGTDGEGAGSASQIVTVVGVGGGVGSTSMCVNVAAALAQDPANSPVIIDLDLTLGDADVWLDIIPDYTIRDVTENVSRLDYGLLKRSLTRHDCGVYLLPRPVEVESQDLVQPDDLRRILALLKATFSHLIIDASKSFGPLDMSAMEVSDRILVVTQLDLTCLRNVVRVIQFLEQANGLDKKVEIVVNRMGLEDTDISLNKALETIGREVFWQLPNDYATMVGSRNNGIPLTQFAPKARLTRSINDLTKRLSMSEDERANHVVTEKKKGGLFGLFSK
ncbi:MAG TPA: CobQ/CobB/MinD/ParA nucleotide binding domain-containing protein [Planctomycetes bacterium]|nr:CobQ/CobB/MinD/ParA nucleotide binding domain-containing protein [Fuerstiella sp.]HIK95332.1 CobQ/CobB/MinD/ParA nucleotide binding domain-containing protein [Planctomycetota bacterium]